jgi:para-nitrobenzyl esterase
MQRRDFLLAASAAVAASPAPGARAAGADPMATTRQGRLAGFEEAGVLKFLGVPFARPPVGALRWAPPQPMPAWSGVRPAKRFGPAAFQEPVPDTYRTGVSEDCLYLNVWTTSLSRIARQPVMVWIHGGGHLSGAGSEAFTDGSNLAKAGVTMVAINYRLGAFGYLNHSVLGANFGVLDQIAALRWVQENIEAFGGDPSRVLIFGYSAGGLSVRNLLKSPLAKGLFNRGVIMSATGEEPPYTPVYDNPRSRAATEKLFESLGTQNIDALRALPADKVHAAARPLSGIGAFVVGPRTPFDLVWQPVPDGKVVMDDSFPSWPADTSVMISTCRNEARYFLNPDQTYAPQYIEDLARKLTGSKADEVLAVLRAGGASPVQQLDHLLTEIIWRESQYTSLERFSRERRQVYYYDFARLPSGGSNSNRLAFHGSDIYYVFGNLTEQIYLMRNPVERRFDDTDRRISRELQRAYIEFARSGVPKGSDGVAWPVYRAPESKVTLVADTVSFAPYPIGPITRLMNPLRSKA